VRGNWGYEGLPPGKIFQTTPSGASKNALLQSRIYIVYLLDLCVEKGKLIP